MGAIFSIQSSQEGDKHNRPLSQPLFRPVQRPDITRKNVEKLFESHEFRDLIAKRLSGAVKIPTVTYDEMGKVGDDPRWNVFYDFSKYLKQTFPKVEVKRSAHRRMNEPTELVDMRSWLLRRSTSILFYIPGKAQILL